MSFLTCALILAALSGGVAGTSGEKQLTHGPLQKDLDNNINFSPDGHTLVFDCRGAGSINKNDRLGKVDVRTGKVTVFYIQKPPVLGLGAPSFLDDHEVVAIHALTSGITYDLTLRGGMIIPVDGSGKVRWLDSRNVLPPFTPGALRGGTHKHEPDASGKWVGFTYNDSIMKARGSDLRNVGVSRRGIRVPVPADPEGRNFEGESFSVLLTACVDDPKPGSDEYGRAEGDCWVGRDGYLKPDGSRQRARAFLGQVAVEEDGKKTRVPEVFVVDVPDDITIPGPLGPLEGTATDYPKPPKGALVRRLTHTAEAHDPRLHGIWSFLRASGDGHWIAYVGKTEHNGQIQSQVFVVSPTTGEIRQLSHLPASIVGATTNVGNVRFSPDSRYVAATASDGTVIALSAEEATWGQITVLTPPNPRVATNLVISPDSHTLAYNREIDGVQQIFCVHLP